MNKAGTKTGRVNEDGKRQKVESEENDVASVLEAVVEVLVPLRSGRKAGCFEQRRYQAG